MLFALLRSKWVTLLWFLIMNVLFFLPGSDLPQHGWFEAIPQFDKLVHFGLFAILTCLFTQAFNVRLPSKGWVVLAFALVYGLLVEFIQLKWVTGRSFDLFDVLADTIGGIAGLLVSWGLYKKINPCRHRGRNQN